MKPLEISLLVLAALPLCYRIWSGWRHGATTEFRYALTVLFAALVAARFWQPATELLTASLTFDPRALAALAFIALFLLAAGVAHLAMGAGAPAGKNAKMNPADQFLGLAGGAVSGVVLAGCVLWVGAIASPGAFAAVPQAQSLAELPRSLVIGAETVSGMAPESPGRTRYPEVTLVDVKVENPSTDLPEGSILVQRRGKIDWR
jgi:uncharacterized membrane protein required for colicin V production